MESFSFYLDTKVTTWYRTPFEIESTSLEKAKKLAIEFIEKDRHSEISWEPIDDTIQGMSVEENDGESTEELYTNSDGEMIWDNSKTN